MTSHRCSFPNPWQSHPMFSHSPGPTPVLPCGFRSYAPWLLRSFTSSSCPHSAGFSRRRGSRTWQWQAASGIASYESVSCVSAGVGPQTAVCYVPRLVLVTFPMLIFYFPDRSPCIGCGNLSGIHQGKRLWNPELVSMLISPFKYLCRNIMAGEFCVQHN